MLWYNHALQYECWEMCSVHNVAFGTRALRIVSVQREARQVRLNGNFLWICLNLIESEPAFLAPKTLSSSYFIIWTVNLQRKHSPTVRRRRASFTVLQKKREEEKRREVRYCPLVAGRLKNASNCCRWESASEPQVSLLHVALLQLQFIPFCRNPSYWPIIFAQRPNWARNGFRANG